LPPLSPSVLENSEPSNQLTRTILPQSITSVTTDKDLSAASLFLETRRHAETYLHHHTFELVPGCGVSLEVAVQRAVAMVQYEQTGQPLKQILSTESSEKTIQIEKTQKQGILRMANAEPLVFSAEDLPLPPNMSYAKDISRLFRDWEDRTCAQVIVKGVHVPYRYWGCLYRDISPTSWKILKQKFSEAKVRFLEYTVYPRLCRADQDRKSWPRSKNATQTRTRFGQRTP